jgi:hypothetical protein
VGAKFGDFVLVAVLHLFHKKFVFEILVFVVELHQFVRGVLVVRPERHGTQRTLGKGFDGFNVFAHFSFFFTT